MKDIVFFSGGICSAYIACTLKDAGHDPICLFSDTKREDVDTYRFAEEVTRRWGLNVIDASDGRDLWEVFRQQNIIPARQIPSCSIAMKIKPAQKWLESFEGPGRVAYGYDRGEEDRAERTRTRWAYPNLLVWFPLIEQDIDKAQTFGYFNAHNVKPPRMYQHFHHANCNPCKNFRENDWQACRYHYPEVFAKAQEFEETFPEGADGKRPQWMQDGPRLADLPPLTTKRRGRRLPVHAPAFSFEMGCDRCAAD